MSFKLSTLINVQSVIVGVGAFAAGFVLAIALVNRRADETKDSSNTDTTSLLGEDFRLDAWVPVTGVEPKGDGVVFRNTKYPFYRFSGTLLDGTMAGLVICPWDQVLNDSAMMEAYLNELLVVCRKHGGGEWGVKATRFISDQYWTFGSMNSYSNPEIPI